MLQPVDTRMILIAGADVTSMQEAAMAIFRAGHMPVLSRWFADPLIEESGLDRDGEEVADHVVQSVTERLLARCDGILRVGGPSADAGAVVGLGRARALRVFFNLKDALDG